MGVAFRGDWARVERILGEKGIKRVADENIKALRRGARKVERRILSHLDEQDLKWPELDEDYAKSKEKRGLSPDTLRASNVMYSNITVEPPVRENGVLTAMVGVQRGVKTANGEEVTDIALIHEQPKNDGKVIPARKLWEPTFNELKEELELELKGATIKVFQR